MMKFFVAFRIIQIRFVVRTAFSFLPLSLRYFYHLKKIYISEFMQIVDETIIPSGLLFEKSKVYFLTKDKCLNMGLCLEFFGWLRDFL